MPRPVGVIQKPGVFTDILTRFGVNRPREPFVLDGDVIPVVVIDSAVSFVASPTPPYRVTQVFSEGILVAPIAGTILATTGPLPVGSYTLKVWTDGPIDQDYDLEWRDAADAANLVVHRFTVLARTPLLIDTRFEIENASERFRLLIAGAGGVGNAYQGTISARL